MNNNTTDNNDITDDTVPSAQDGIEFARLAQGFINSQLLFISAKLELPQLLSSGSKSLAQLTELTQSHGPSLKRFLRGLSTLRVITEVEHERYAKGPLLAMVNNLMAPGFGQSAYSAWEKAIYSVKTGKPAWDQVFGQPFYEYLDSHQTESHAFDQWNADSAYYLDPLISAYDFGQFNTLVDVGGGQGAFMNKVLQDNPDLQGVIFDREEVILKTTQTLKTASAIDRIETHSGSFFDSVPQGADAYTLCRVLINWDDEQVIRILSNCKKSMIPSAKLLILDFCIPQADHPFYPSIVVNDLNLLVNYGGGARSTQQWCSLVAAAGLKVQSQLTAPPSILFLLEVVIDQ